MRIDFHLIWAIHLPSKVLFSFPPVYYLTDDHNENPKAKNLHPTLDMLQATSYLAILLTPIRKQTLLALLQPVIRAWTRLKYSYGPNLKIVYKIRFYIIKPNVRHVCETIFQGINKHCNVFCIKKTL